MSVNTALSSAGGSDLGRAGASATDVAKYAPFDASNRALYPVATGSYISYLETRQTSAAAAGQTIWNFRGPPTLKAFIRRLFLNVGFDGTVPTATATTLRYGVYLGTGSASPTGGTVRLAQRKSSSVGATSTVTDVRQDLTGAGLTTTSITYAADPIAVASLPIINTQVASPTTSASAGFSMALDLKYDPFDFDNQLMIGANEHLAIRLQTVAAIIGLSCCGFIEWQER